MFLGDGVQVGAGLDVGAGVAEKPQVGHLGQATLELWPAVVHLAGEGEDAAAAGFAVVAGASADVPPQPAVDGRRWDELAAGFLRPCPGCGPVPPAPALTGYGWFGAPNDYADTRGPLPEVAVCRIATGCACRLPVPLQPHTR